MRTPFRVLLIASNAETRPYPVYPLGAAVIARVLEEREIEVHGLDCCFLDDPAAAVAAAAAEHRPHLVGLSLRAVDTTASLDPRSYLPQVAELVASLRRASGAPLVLGGAGFSLFPELLMDRLGADYGVIGEGEETAAELVHALRTGADPAGTPGLLVRSREGVRGATRRAPSPVERWRRPSRRAFPLDAHLAAGGMASVQTKRGCPFTCSYCTYPQLEGARLRLRDPAAVVEEVAELADHGADYLFFVDNNFNLPSEHAAAVCHGLAGLANRPDWSAFLTPAGFDPRLPELMAAGGARSLELGSESGSPEVLAALGKHHCAGDIVAWDAALSAVGVAPAHYFIFGGPDESADSVERSLELVQSLRGPVAAMLGVRVYPGTALHRRAVAEGLLRADDNLLEPRFYLSPKVDAATVAERLLEVSSSKRNLILIGAERNDAQPLIERLRQRGRKGPLWEYLRP